MTFLAFLGAFLSSVLFVFVDLLVNEKTCLVDALSLKKKKKKKGNYQCNTLFLSVAVERKWCGE